MNVERALIAAECLGDCEFFLQRGTQYARERRVFGKPLADNQGVAFPLARGYVQYKAAEAITANALADGKTVLRLLLFGVYTCACDRFM